MIEIICKNKTELPQIASLLLESFPNDRFYAFFGNMGAGKTTLIKEICSILGVTDNVCSPTFSIVNEYINGEGSSIYHFDFYRLNNLEETYDMGYEEYFYSGNYCFTEWSEKIEPLLPQSYIRVDIQETNNGVRKFIATRIE